MSTDKGGEANGYSRNKGHRTLIYYDDYDLKTFFKEFKTMISPPFHFWNEHAKGNSSLIFLNHNHHNKSASPNCKAATAITVTVDT